MTDVPERIWIEDEFGDDEDQWTYGTWDVRNYRGYVVEYVRADLTLPAVQPDAAAIREAALREVLNAIWRDDLGEEATAMYNQIIALIDRPAHVNETPKSEHEAANVLTPAKGDTHD